MDKGQREVQAVQEADTEGSAGQRQSMQEENESTELLQLLDRLSSDAMAEDNSGVLRQRQLSQAASRDEELLSGLQAFGL